ncbi:MAG: VIT domain-containing protein, partial [Anaerolineae bacterium]
MFNPLAFANAAPAGVAVLETIASDERLITRMPFVPLRRTTVNGRWEGPLAELTITHTYAYTRAQCDSVLEAVYRFPLPGDAAVRRVVVTFGDVEIVAELKERRAAEQDYEEAKREGRQAALTTRESPDVFTLRVAGLQPDQEVVVETTCVLLANATSSAGAWSLRIPLTTAPRYTRQDEVVGRGAGGRRRSANAQPLAVFRDPGHRFALDLITATGRISSTTHVLSAVEEDGHTRTQLAQGELLPDRDCVLTWAPVQAREDTTLHVLTGEQSEHTYFVALVSPPMVAVE